VLKTISRLPLRPVRALGRLVRRIMRLAIASAVLTALVFILDVVLLRDPRRPDEPEA
jgi:hypothetical protein